MARRLSPLRDGRAARQIRRLAHPAPVVLALAIVVALMAGLMGSARMHADTRAVTSPDVATAIASDPASTTDPGPAVTLDHDTASDVVRTAGSLLPAQINPGARALARLGADGRFLAVLLTGLLLAIIGRRPPTRRPVVVPIPVTAAPGLQVRRRGPPPR